MNSLIIKTNNLVKSFGAVNALNELNLQIPKGISGFIGRNGAGKTTTVGILLGLTKPNYGEATVFGLDCWLDSYEIKQRMGVMHEVNAYPRSFTGKRFLEHVAQIYGITSVEQRVTDILKDVGLVESGNRKISSYSAGMFRRLGLAQALLGNPEFVILDEPTANIDPFGRITLLEKIEELHKEHGTSFLISTHILSDLERLCNWLSIIDAGKIVDQGNVKELSEKYSANVFKIEVSNPALFLQKVEELDSVSEVWMNEENVYCKVKNVDAFYWNIPALLADLKLQLKNFQKIVGTLEEIYKKIASEQ